MPPRLPDRYALEVRIGRDGDVEEWLANDVELQRPCLVRVLGPESTDERRREFLEAVRNVAAVPHLHLAQVFAADELEDGAFSVSEWPGGIRLSDRSSADLSLDPSVFLPNAEGLASALAALHEHGEVHGAIDASAVFFPIARPAKLGAIGRHRRWSLPGTDTTTLAAVLEEALTGQPAGSFPPSQVVDGVSPALDHALAAARAGRIDAAGLAELLASVPVSAPPEPGRGPSRRWVMISLILLVLAVVLIALGSGLRPGPVAVPGESGESLPGSQRSTTTTVAAPITIVEEGLRVSAIVVFDPLGDGEERDSELVNLTDGDPETAWRTESYFDPLPLIKAGVGLQVTVTGVPRQLLLQAISPGTELEVRWTPEFRRNPSEWELVATARAAGPTLAIELPVRGDGLWLVWITQVPAEGDRYRASIGELGFR